ncbi:MAG: conjugal transfer protein TraX [Lachnospiraceae bacterium]|nr:conjugal transfer protein TraX [Lachnospiraceae bacterium]
MKEQTQGLSVVRKDLSATQLKTIALVCMFLDHFAGVYMGRYLMAEGIPFMSSFNVSNWITVLYYVMRGIGRVAFPIYAFLICEGAVHTRNIWKYWERLLAFAIISEIPFDLCLNITRSQALERHVIEFGYQNVFFTLAIGLLVIIGLQKIETKNFHPVIAYVLRLGCIFAGMLLGYFLKTDYGMAGVLVIAAMYMYRTHKMLAVGIGCVLLSLMSILEIPAFLCMIPVFFYHGRKGVMLGNHPYGKYVFYGFYPVHLLILAVASIVSGF